MAGSLMGISGGALASCLLGAVAALAAGSVRAQAAETPGLFTIMRMVPVAPGQLRLRSLRLGGSLVQEFDMAQSQGGDARIGSSTHLDARLNGTGYYWQPWFATVEAGVNVSMDVYKSLSDRDLEARKSGSDSMSISSTLFPSSRFPLTLYFNASERHTGLRPLANRTDTVIQFGFNQQYRPVGRDDRYRYGYGRSLRTRRMGAIEAYATVNDRVSGSAEIDLGRWDTLDLRGNFDRFEDFETGELRRNAVASASHRIEPREDLAIASTASLTNAWLRAPNGGSERDVLVALLSSSQSWDPEGKPYRASGSVRLGATQVDVDGAVTRNLTTGLSAAGSYDIYRGRRTRVVASANVSRFSSGDSVSWGLSSRQGVNWNYSLPSGVWKGFRYGAIFQAGANHELGLDQESRLVGSVGGSQSLSRAWDWRVGAWRFTASHSSGLRQSYNSSAEGGVTASLNHAATAEYRRSVVRGRGDRIQLRATDSHRFTLVDDSLPAGLDESVQQLTFDYSHLEGFSTGGELTLGYRFRASRKATRDFSGGVAYGSGLSAAYRVSNLLGVTRLDYSTTLSLDSDHQFVPRSLGDEGDVLSWNQSLTHSIGRLRTSFTTGFNRSNGRYDLTARLRLERRFGR